MQSGWPGCAQLLLVLDAGEGLESQEFLVGLVMLELVAVMVEIHSFPLTLTLHFQSLPSPHSVFSCELTVKPGVLD